MTELVIAIVIVGIVLAVVYVVGGGMKASSKGDAAFTRISSVISGIERAKQDHGGVYIAQAATKISLTPLLVQEMGGAANTRDVADWTYACAAGSDKTITLTTTNFESTDVANLAAAKVNGNLAPWNAVAAGSTLTLTLNNIVCR